MDGPPAKRARSAAAAAAAAFDGSVATVLGGDAPPAQGEGERLLAEAEAAAAAAMAAGDGDGGGEEDTLLLDARALRRVVVSFEKRLNANVEARMRYADKPEKFMDSELALDAEVRALGALAASPELYPEFVRLGAVPTAVGLLAHENVDIACGAVSLLAELTDADAEDADEDEDNEEAYVALADAIIAANGLELLISTLERLDESQQQEAAGANGCLTCLENLTSIDPKHAAAVCEGTRFVDWACKRVNAEGFDANKQYTSEVLAILMQSAEGAKAAVVAKGGTDAILRAIAPYKRKAPAGGDEEEHCQNLFDCLCCIVMGTEGKAAFVEAEGIELMCIVARSKDVAPAARVAAFRALDFACTRYAPACKRLVDVRGLGTTFSAFMGKGAAAAHKQASKGKGKKRTEEDTEALSDERCVSLVASLATELEDTDRLDRVLAKFVEQEYEKLDRLFELLDSYLERYFAAEKALPAGLDEAEVRHHAGARPRARVRISCYLVRVGRAACAPAIPLQARVGTYLYTPSARCH